MTSPRTTAILVMAVVVLAGILLTPVTIVRVQAGDRSIACTRVSDGTPIILTFTHSMYGGEVRETWRPGPAGLVQDRIVTERAAAAEYYAWDGRVVTADDGYEVLIADPLQVAALAIRVDQVGRHRLRIGSDLFDLASLLPGSTHVVLSSDQRPLLQHALDQTC